MELCREETAKFRKQRMKKEKEEGLDFHKFPLWGFSQVYRKVNLRFRIFDRNETNALELAVV